MWSSGDLLNGCHDLQQNSRLNYGFNSRTACTMNKELKLQINHKNMIHLYKMVFNIFNGWKANMRCNSMV